MFAHAPRRAQRLRLPPQRTCFLQARIQWREKPKNVGSLGRLQARNARMTHCGFHCKWEEGGRTILRPSDRRQRFRIPTKKENMPAMLLSWRGCFVCSSPTNQRSHSANRTLRFANKFERPPGVTFFGSTQFLEAVRRDILRRLSEGQWESRLWPRIAAKRQGSCLAQGGRRMAC